MRRHKLFLLGIILSSVGVAACSDTTCGPGTHLNGKECVPGVAGVTTAFVSSITADRPSGSAVYVNNPLQVTFGAISQGEEKDVLVTLGLMEKPAADATDADLQNLTSCILQGSEIHLRGDGSEQLTQFNATVPPECLAGAAERTFNFQLIVDLVENNTGESPAQKILVFNEREQGDAINQKCHMLDADGNDSVGCVVDLDVKPSPGLDIALTTAQPSSSVVVVYPPAQDPNVPAGQAETPRGALAVETSVRAYGQSDEDANAGQLPAAVTLTYEAEAQPDETGVGFMPLAVNSDSMVTPVSTLAPGQTTTFNPNLMLTDDVRALVAQGGAWYGIDNFLIRVCASVPFAEQGDPLFAGGDGTQNNCKTFPVRFVPATTPPSLANSTNADKDYSASWGSKSAIEADFTAYSHNDLDLAGATSDQRISLGIDGLFGKFSVFEGWGTATATISPGSVGLDAGVTMFGNKVFGYNKSAGTVSYSYDANFSNEFCEHYVFAALIIPVEVSFCVSGTGGLNLATTLSPTSLAPSVRPYASLDASASASVGDVGFRVRVNCDATILGVNNKPNDGLAANLQLSLVNSNPLTVGTAVNVNAQLDIDTLDIDFGLQIDLQEPDICKKKIAGIKIKYPCFNWHTVESYTIASFNGFSFPYTLLNRSFTATLQ